MKTQENEVATLVASLMVDLHDLVQDEKCDHSVGICWCDQHRHVEEAATWLDDQGYGYLALDIVKKVRKQREADKDRLC